MKETTAPAADARDLVDASLDRLEDSHRQVLVLRYMQSLSLEESAQRLGITPQAVAKRAERALDKLRVHLRHLGIEQSGDSLIALIQLPAAHLTESQLALMTKAATGAVSSYAGDLATMTNSAMASVGLKFAAIAAAGLVVLGGTAAIVQRHSTPASAQAAVSTNSQNITSPLPAVAAAQTTSPVISVDGAQQFASLFLDALSKQDTARLAGMIDARSPAEQSQYASVYITGFADHFYPNFPSRMTLITDCSTMRDAAGNLVIATISTAPPTEADLRHLSVVLAVKNGQWLAHAIYFGMGYPPPTNFTDRLAGTHSTDLDPDLVSLSKSAWNPGPGTEFTPSPKVAKLWEMTPTLQPSTFAEKDIPRNSPRPPATEPTMTFTAPWDGTQLSIPGLLIIPPWLKDSSLFKNPPSPHGFRIFRTADDDGATYELFSLDTVGLNLKNIEPQNLICQIRQYRKDGSLAAIAHTSDDGTAVNWCTLDATGTRMTFWAQRNTDEKVVQAHFFNAAGGYEDYEINKGQLFEQLHFSPIGRFLKNVHSTIGDAH